VSENKWCEEKRVSLGQKKKMLKKIEHWSGKKLRNFKLLNLSKRLGKDMWYAE